ncbi:MAG: GumC family protein [Bacillota bacterium]
MDEAQKDLEQVGEIDLRQYIDVILKWKWTIILITIGCALTGYIISAFFMTPIYEAGSVLMVTQPTNEERVYRQEDGSLESTVDSFSRIPQLNLNTYTNQFKNTEILNNVIKKMNLDQKGYTPQTLARNIDITGDPETNVLEVKVQNADPALATSITNTLLDEYYAFLFASNQKQMKESVAYLKEQLKQTEAELKKASEMYQKGKSRERNAEVVEQELTSKMDILTNSKTLLIQSQVELEQLAAGKQRLEKNLASTPKNLVTKKDEREEQANSGDAAEKATTGITVTEEVNPVYLELVKSLNEKDDQIAQAKSKIAGLNSNIAMLEKEIASLQTELSKKQLEENTVKRKYDTLEEAYTVLNTKIIETEIAKSVDFGRIGLTQISPAYYPNSPVKPNIKLNIAIAAILGLMLGVFLSFALEFFDDTVKTTEDLQKQLGLPVLAAIPMAKQ